MSSVPPGAPPGGGQPPYTPYDPKTQWRIYREQQKAAWRAQRDAMKAQRYAAKAGYYGGAYVPHVPSVIGPIILIGIGVVALLVVTGHIAAGEFWTWYAHWWPLLLIGSGLALLGEWFLDMRSKTPVDGTTGGDHSARSSATRATISSTPSDGPNGIMTSKFLRRRFSRTLPLRSKIRAATSASLRATDLRFR